MYKSKRFSNITPAPAVEVFDVYFGHMRDTFEKKVNLGIGGKSIKFHFLYIRYNFWDFGFWGNSLSHRRR